MLINRGLRHIRRIRYFQLGYSELIHVQRGRRKRECLIPSLTHFGLYVSVPGQEGPSAFLNASLHVIMVMVTTWRTFGAWLVKRLRCENVFERIRCKFFPQAPIVDTFAQDRARLYPSFKYHGVFCVMWVPKFIPFGVLGHSYHLIILVRCPKLPYRTIRPFFFMLRCTFTSVLRLNRQFACFPNGRCVVFTYRGRVLT